MENYYVFLIFSALDRKKILYYDELIMNDMDFLINKQEFSFASVLIPLIRDGGCPSVLFEVRGSNLSQPGEVCFPGGGIEPFESPLQAAVRETKEELLISEDQLHHISPVGLLPTPSGRLIYAYAAELTGYCGSFSQDEVSKVFQVPLSFFLHTPPEVYYCHVSVTPGEDFPYPLVPHGRDYKWRSGRYPTYFYQYEGHVIWGLTAKILYDYIKKGTAAP